MVQNPKALVASPAAARPIGSQTILLVFVLVAAAGIYFFHESYLGPVYQNHRISYWFTRLPLTWVSAKNTDFVWLNPTYIPKTLTSFHFGA